MKSQPIIYLSPHFCQGSHNGGWVEDLATEGLPPGRSWVNQLPQDVFAAENVALLISDALMHPLRVTLEEKVKKAELAQYLTWKLKRYLPWPVDQVSLRYLPLAEENTWLTFSLPKPWLQGVFDAFKERQVHCGYVGGAFATLLENQPHLKGHANLCFFEDYYLMADLDGGGNYQSFSSRRLPFKDTEQQEMDVETLQSQDLAPLLDGLERPLQLFSFARALDGAVGALSARLQQASVQVVRPPLNGSPLDRLRACLYAEEGVW